MAADFEAEIKNSLRSLASQVTALGAVVNSSEAKVSKLGDSLQKAFKRGTQAIPVAKQQVDALGQSIQKAGQAAQRMGGPLGEIVGRLTGGAGMTGGLAKAAVAAGLLGLAMKAGTAVIDVRIIRIGLLIDAQKKLSDATAKANEEAKGQALGASASQGGNLRTLFSRGNIDAIDTANSLEKSGIDTTDNIQKGVAKAYTLTGHNQKETVIAGAQHLANMGEMNFDQAVSALMADRPAIKSMMTTNGFKNGLVKFIAKNRGVSRSPENLSAISRQLDFSENNANSPEGLIAELNKTQGTLNGINRIGQNRVFNGEASIAASDQLATALDPMSTQMLEVMRQHLASQQRLEKLAEQQNIFFRSWENMTNVQGSYEVQRRRGENAFANAQFGNGN